MFIRGWKWGFTDAAIFCHWLSNLTVILCLKNNGYKIYEMLLNITDAIIEIRVLNIDHNRRIEVQYSLSMIMFAKFGIIEEKKTSV